MSNGSNTDDPTKHGVRDPRLVGTAPVVLVDPRRPPTWDLIAVQRRWLLEKAATGKNLDGAESPSRAFEKFESVRPPPPPATVSEQPSAASEPSRTASAPAVEPQPQSQTFAPPPNSTAFRDADLHAQLTALPYRYTKGNDITNDEMGYGERTFELFWMRGKGGKLEELTRVSQRTKSGRQFLYTIPKPRS